MHHKADMSVARDELRERAHRNVFTSCVQRDPTIRVGFKVSHWSTPLTTFAFFLFCWYYGAWTAFYTSLVLGFIFGDTELHINHAHASATVKEAEPAKEAEVPHVDPETRV